MAKADTNKSMPGTALTQRDKNHGVGYPIDIDSIENAAPSHGITDRGKSNAHAFSHDAHGNTGIDPVNKDRRGGGVSGKRSGAAGKNSKTSLKGSVPVSGDRRG